MRYIPPYLLHSKILQLGRITSRIRFLGQFTLQMEDYMHPALATILTILTLPIIYLLASECSEELLLFLAIVFLPVAIILNIILGE